jgi:hypothetical protein
METLHGRLCGSSVGDVSDLEEAHPPDVLGKTRNRLDRVWIVGGQARVSVHEPTNGVALHIEGLYPEESLIHRSRQRKSCWRESVLT